MIEVFTFFQYLGMSVPLLRSFDTLEFAMKCLSLLMLLMITFNSYAANLTFKLKGKEVASFPIEQIKSGELQVKMEKSNPPRLNYLMFSEDIGYLRRFMAKTGKIKRKFHSSLLIVIISSH
jgi:hypothetical protein